MEPIYKLLGQRIRAERQSAGLTLEQLGEKAGITGAFVAHIEAGRKNATLRTVGKIAKALDLTVSELVADQKAPNSQDHLHLNQLARLLRNKTPAQKRTLLDLVKKASELIR